MGIGKGTIKEAINESNIDVPLSTVARTRVYEQTFEDGTTDTTTSNATQTVQSTEVYAGTYALQITILAGQTGYVETPKRPVSPFQQVTFAFAHKEDANITDIKLIVVWYRASGGVISTEEYTLTPSTAWAIDARTVSAPQNAATMALRVQATAGAADGNVYVDEITIDVIGQVLRVDGAGQVKVADTDLLDGLKPIRDTPTQELSSYSLAGGATANINKSALDGYSAIVVTVKATYDASATAGVRVRWLYSMDGVNYDSPEDAEAQGNYEDLTFLAGATRQRTVLVPILAPYVRIQIVNQDATYAATLDVWTSLMR